MKKDSVKQKKESEKEKKESDKRQHPRYDTKVKVYFEIDYDLETKLKFQMVGPKEGALSREYSGISKNVSVEGLCFNSDIRLNKGDKLHIGIYLPTAKEPIKLEGEVRWSRPTSSGQESVKQFDTGVRLISVEHKDVLKTIHFDENYGVYWSDVLESILGKFKEIGKKRTSKG